MELALYDEHEGYYMTVGSPSSDQVKEDSRIGWSGDFYTASDVHPLLAQCVCKQIRECDELLGHPTRFTVIEMGPGKGLFAQELLRECSKLNSDFSQRLTYLLVERSQVMKSIQERNLHEYIEKGWLVEWHSSLADLDTQSVHGVVFSNEFVDALPVHRIKRTEKTLKEIMVDYRDGEFCERCEDLTISDIDDYLDGMDTQWPQGYCTEIHLESVRWMKDVARVLERGFVLTIDYGHTAQDYYDVSRKDGTLLCYYQHKVSTNPYVRVGEQDITAHVNFTALATHGLHGGLKVTGYTNLMNFLLGLGADMMLSQLDPGSEEMQLAIQFLRPQSMGQTFKVFIQHKGVESPSLAGLTFRPFFDGALLGTGPER